MGAGAPKRPKMQDGCKRIGCKSEGRSEASAGVHAGACAAFDNVRDAAGLALAAVHAVARAASAAAHAERGRGGGDRWGDVLGWLGERWAGRYAWR